MRPVHTMPSDLKLGLLLRIHTAAGYSCFSGSAGKSRDRKTIHTDDFPLRYRDKIPYPHDMQVPEWSARHRLSQAGSSERLRFSRCQR